MMNLNTLTFIGCDHTYKDADIVLFGAPFDGTTSYRPGTRFAPQVIRLDSDGLETYSPYLDKDLLDKKIADIGDLTMTFGNKHKSLKTIKETAQTIISANKKPLMIGGEHLVTLPVVEALYEKYPDLQLIQFDAHTDLRDDYLGEKLSHATVVRRVHDLLGDDKIHQFGMRSGTKEEFDFAKKHTFLERFTVDTIKDRLTHLKDIPLYVTIDLDILDPSIMSGTGTPEPGGITFKELLVALKQLEGLNIVGCDIVELAPDYDASGVSTAVASKVIREMLLLL